MGDTVRAVIAAAVERLDAEHRDADGDANCLMCRSEWNHWQCASRQVADDLRALLAKED